MKLRSTKKVRHQSQASYTLVARDHLFWACNPEPIAMLGKVCLGSGSGKLK